MKKNVKYEKTEVHNEPKKKGEKKPTGEEIMLSAFPFYQNAREEKCFAHGREVLTCRAFLVTITRAACFLFCR